MNLGLKSTLLIAVIAHFANPTGATVVTPAPDTHVGRITLTTTQAGFPLPAGQVIQDYPLLVRFDGDQFPWGEANPDGSDITFENNANVQLPASIEEWNPQAKRAAIWVRVPLIRGDDRQSITVKWGKSRKISQSVTSVFDASNGFSSVLHLRDQALDEVNTLTLRSEGATTARGAIGPAASLRQGSGFAGELQPGKALPTGSQPSTTSAWVRVRKPNSTIVGWGKEAAQGKVVMQFRSPAHINMDCYFSDAGVKSSSKAPLGEWMHVSHVYTKGVTRLYIDGRLEGTNTGQGAPLAIADGSRLWLGGWYGNYDFDGDIDEVRISNVARTAAWVALDSDTQGTSPRLTGRLVRSDSAPTVSTTPRSIDEGATVQLAADLGNADKAYWELISGGTPKRIATDHERISFTAPRIAADTPMTLRLRTISSSGERVHDIPLSVRNTIADPSVMLAAPSSWDGREPAYIRADVQGKGPMHYQWHVSGPGVAYEASGNILRLDRGFKAGNVSVRVDVDNGGDVVSRNVVIRVSPPSNDPWTDAPPMKMEQLRSGMFISRGMGNSGRVAVTGSTRAGATVELRAAAKDGWIRAIKTNADAKGTFTVQTDLPARLTMYSLQLVSTSKGKTDVLASASDVQCGDAFIIMGQSNAVATDFGQITPSFTSPWIQTFTDKFVPARYRNTDGQSGEIGYWGMELARKLVTKHNIPVCIVNGAVGGTRIDQHQRLASNPTDATTLYGRLLGRIAGAGLQHGVRAIFWHQGENDQGADGPSGGFGHETYRSLFINLSNAWAMDYPNSRMTYMFQIWPKSCAMGFDGSDNVLRDVQRCIPDSLDRVAIMSTLGIDPPGGCHFPADGYAAMANLIYPLVEQHTYGIQPKSPICAPRLLSAVRKKSEVILTFDQPVIWADSLRSEFLVDGKRGRVLSGLSKGNTLRLSLAAPSGKQITYLDSASWSQQRLLRGMNGIAALTFEGVAIR
ncbi:MAG: DUF2341 domain-containing protein [Planctomycetota bacterium]|nr:MAG: DUF2341 domain-containing protein [Planctomycetota bacterium]